MRAEQLAPQADQSKGPNNYADDDEESLASDGTNFGLWDTSVWDQEILKHCLQAEEDGCYKESQEAYDEMIQVRKREREEDKRARLKNQRWYETEEGRCQRRR